jgi:integrase/recombinase XerD
MTNATLLGPWVRRFLLEHVVAERNLAVNTKKSYRDMLKLLLPYAAKEAKKAIDRLTLEDLSPARVRQFLGHIELQRRCTITTRNQRLAGLHALARFIGENSPEHIEWCAQIRLIPLKKSSKPAISYLDNAEMQALLAATDRQTAQGRREHALLIFLYNAGARASEAAELQIGNIDWHAECVTITGKGQKQRRCPLWSATIEQLQMLVGKRETTAPVFLNRNHEPMTRSGIYALVKRCAVRASAQRPSLQGKAVGPHVIRHSTASHLLQAGVDINTIRGWLGHVSLTTTNVYAEINLETKARALAACAVDDETQSTKRWRDQPDLMAFLNTL